MLQAEQRVTGAVRQIRGLAPVGYPKVSGYSETKSLRLESRSWGPYQPQATCLPGQEKRPCADIDVLVSASQAAAVLLKVVPGILVEVWHLVGNLRLRASSGTFRH